MANAVARQMEPILFLLLFAVGLSTAATEAPGKATTEGSLPSCFGELTEVPLPENLEWARDVRWLGEQEVAIGAPRWGVLRLHLDRPGAPLITEIADGGWRSASSSPWSVGSSQKYLVVGAPMFAVGWKAIGVSGLTGDDYFEFISDLDVRGDRLLVLGMRKSEDGGHWAEEGAFVWLGSMAGTSLAGTSPLAFSADGSRARPMDGCGPLSIGAVRFLENGSFVVVPVAEPGVLLFRPNGRLARTWQGKDFGLNEGCELTEEHFYRLGIDLDLRMEWINRRTIVDDILPLVGDRFGLLVRRHTNGITQWRMEIADTSGSVGACEVPLTVANRWVHLRADRRGERVVLLQIARVNQLQPPRLAAAARLFVTPITGASTTGTNSTHCCPTNFHAIPRWS